MNTKKRFLITLLCVAALLICICGLVACNGKKGDECVHSWNEWQVEQEATCNLPGIKKQTCSLCTETRTETIDKLGHKGGTATCAGGAICERCGTAYTDPAAHAWADATCQAPKTCTVCGTTDGDVAAHTGGAADCVNYGECTVCGAKYIDPNGHTWVAATCASPKVCVDCGATDGAALEHTGGKATCTDKAICEVCKAAYGELANHAWMAATCQTPKTCAICEITEGEVGSHVGGTATCVEYAVCTICGMQYGELIDHVWVEASCSAPKTCTGCGMTEGEALEHAWVPATCTMLETCSKCGLTRGEVAGHSWTGATCTAPDTCSVCGATEGEPNGHDYNVTTVEPECLEKGYDEYTCSVCGDSYQTNEVDALGHNWSEPTCASDRTCTGCDETQPALSHNYELTSSDNATCTSAQMDTYTCSGCGDYYTEPVGSELGHNIAGVEPDERAVAGTTCDYVQVYECNTCGEEIDGDPVSHHEYIAKVTTEATCTADGVKTLTCTDCGHITTEKIEKNTGAHIWNDGVLSGNIRTYTCTQGCGNTKTAVDASQEESAKVNASDLAQAGGVDLKGASMALDSTTLGAVANKDLTLSAGTLSGDELAAAKNTLTPEQQEQLGDNPIYNFTMNDGNENITSFGGGYITITLPYNVPDGDDVDSVAIWYISEGKPVCIEAAYSNGYVTFQTDHFSYYSVTRLTPEERCLVYGHNIRESVVDVSCTRDGYTLEVCIRCAVSTKTNIVSATGHNYTSVETPATCTEAGNITYTCGCGYSYKTRLAATGHSWSVVDTKEATCAEAGYTKYGCSECDSEYSQVAPKTKHSYVDSVVAPTCTENGYTLHTCEACGQSYSDGLVAAMGHNYKNSWSWGADNKSAVLSFVCMNDASHVVGMNATVIESINKPTCEHAGYADYTAQVVYLGVLYSDYKTVNLPKLDHVSDGKTYFDDINHYSLCTLCGGKANLEAHTLGSEQIIKAATCTEEGEAKYFCSCGYEKTKKLPVIAHNFVNGKCSACGKFSGDCDHSQSNATVTIDFGSFGACEGSITFNTCDCGEALYIPRDTQGFGGCSLEPDYTDQGVNDAGNMYVVMSGYCLNGCGLKMEAYGEAVRDGCTMHITYEYSAMMGDTVIFEKAMYFEEMENHNDDYKDFTITGSSCGDMTGRARICADCGKFTYLSSLNAGCMQNIAFKDVEYIDDDGFIHEGEVGTCTKCGFKFVMDEYYRYSGCFIEYFEVTYIENTSGERVFEIIESDSGYEHDYESTYELNGTSCTDGVKIIRTCKACGSTYTSTTTNHYNTSVVAEYNLSEYGACGGTVRVYACPCGVYGYVSEKFDCRNLFDAGSVQLCEDCGLTYVYKTEEYKDGCHRYWYSTYNISVNGRVVIADLRIATNIENDHNYEYTYTLYGDSCSDGYYVVRTCLDCGYSYEDEYSAGSQYHNTFRIKSVRFSDYGACDGYIEVYACPCGAEAYTSYNRECGNTEYLGSENYTDDSGAEHEVSSWRCLDCGIVWSEDSYYVMDGCLRRRYATFDVSINDTVILDSYTAITGTEDYHSYEMNVNLYGESCYDGYYLEAVCRECGYSYTREGSYHDTFNTAYYGFSRYGACGGYLAVRSCACGEYGSVETKYNCKFEWRSGDSYVDGDGIRHQIETGICQECGFELTIDSSSVKNANCTIMYNKIFTGVMDGETVIPRLETVSSSYTVSHNYEYSYDLYGQSCEDGYNMTATCRDCGYSYSEENNYHNTNNRTYYEFSDYGACGGYVEYSVCACGQKTYFNYNMWNCETRYTEDEYYVDDNGIKHTVSTRFCEKCGLTLVTDSYDYKTGCQKHTYTVLNAKINEDVIISSIEGVYSTWDSHDYEYTYDLYGESCEDGVMIYGVCKDCGNNYEYECDYHYTYYNKQYNLEEYGACGGYINIRDCACGYAKYVDVSMDCDYEYTYDNYTDDFGIYHEIYTRTCTECALEIIRDYYTVKEGCWYIWYYAYTVRYGGVTIIENEKDPYSRSSAHNYSYDFMLYGVSCEDGYSVSATCRDCGDYWQEERYGCYETYTIDYIENTAEYGVCGGYIRTYSCPCGREKGIDYEAYECTFESTTEYYTDAEGREHSKTTYACTKCGLVMAVDTYEYNDGCYYYSIRTIDFCIGDTYLIEGFTFVYDDWERHNYEYSFNMYGTSCEDGYDVMATCRDCGYSYESENCNYHQTFLKVKYDLNEHGECSGEGYFELYECPCGQYSDFYWSAQQDHYTHDKHFDEEGHLVYVDAWTCDTCGLRIQYSYYTVRDASVCKNITYYTVVISTNTSAIEPIKFKDSDTAHDYEIRGELDEGADSCEDGVYIYYECRDCEYSYRDHYTWHRTYAVQMIDLAQYGSVCGGYLTEYRCVCGYSKSVDIGDTLCELDYVYVDCWKEGAIDTSIYTAAGYQSFDSYAREYTCAVTDPERCAFKIRMTEYWLEIGRCTAQKYQEWLIGYDEATGSYEYKISFEVGSPVTYHDYEYTEINTSTERGYRYDCPDCGSYYYSIYYYNSNGQQTKYEWKAVNTLDDGQNKSKTETYEYSYRNGNSYRSKRRYEYVRADGSVYWDETTFAYGSYTASFGSNSYKTIETYKSSNGETRTTEYAYTSYKNCLFTMYEHVTESNGDWYKYDYSYSFSGGCKRTTSYSNNKGESNTETNSYHANTTYRITVNPTCTQDGAYENYCYICESVYGGGVETAYGHSWSWTYDEERGEYYYCWRCGIENANGANGQIILEDMMDDYGNGTHYVVGYCVRNEVNFMYYVSLVLHTPLDNGDDEIILDDVNITDRSDIRAKTFSISEVQALAQALGYSADEYDVRFTFVPEGGDLSFDYSLTFTD